MKKKQASESIVSNFFSVIRKLVFRRKKSESQEKYVQKIKSKHYETYSDKKQKKINDFCEQLFERQDLVSAGRLQLLGLDKIKKRLGKTWSGLRPIVYQTVEASAEKFLDPRDLFIRYKDNSFLIIFAVDEGAIAEAKVMLIVEEIRKALFEHVEKDLRNVEVKSSVTNLKSSHFKDKEYTPKSIDNAMSVALLDEEKGKAEKKEIIIPKAIEVQTSSQNRGKGKQDDDITPKAVYMPLWDIKNEALTTYLYCPHHKNTSQLSKADIAKLDLAALKGAIDCIETLISNNLPVIVLCPVHFETLSYGPSNEQYRIACQALGEDCSKFLKFMVTNFPAKIENRRDDFKKKIEPFKIFSSSLWAEWAVRAKLEAFETLAYMGFDTVIYKLNQHQDEAWNIKNMTDFISMAQKSRVKKTMALGISSLSLTTSAVCSGFNYIGGSAVHDYVDFPDKIDSFENKDLFSAFSEGK